MESNQSKEIETNEDRFRLLADSAPVGIFQTDLKGNCLYTNQRWQQMTGLDFEHNLGHGWIKAIHPEDRLKADEEWKKCSDQNNEFCQEFRLSSCTEKVCWVQARAVPLRAADGKKIGYVGSMEDISSRKQAEENLRKAHDELEQHVQERTEKLFETNKVLRAEIQERQRFEDELRKTDEQLRVLNMELDERVHQRTAQLEAANKELEAFSYSVSHDLKAPLRAIEGFTKILREDCSAQLNTEGQHYIDVIISSTRTISQFLDGLLTYSRLGRQELRYSRVNVQELVETSINELKPANRSVDFKVNSLPAVAGDLSLLQHIWKHLLENAIKFTGPKEEALIEIGARTETDRIIYYVKDNGVGFDMKYGPKLFKLFQRLHGEKEFDGIGVGLSVAQRLIHRHNGIIWAEAEPKKGATFFFSIPTAKNGTKA